MVLAPNGAKYSKWGAILENKISGGPISSMFYMGFSFCFETVKKAVDCSLRWNKVKMQKNLSRPIEVVAGIQLLSHLQSRIMPFLGVVKN